MGGTSSLDLMTGRFESGMPRLVLQLAILWRGIPLAWHPSPTLLMGATSSLDLGTRRFEFGMSRLVQLVGLQMEKLRVCGLLLCTLPMGSALFLDLMATLPVWGSHFCAPLVIRFMLLFVHDLTHRVGSEIQTAAYSIGYLWIVVEASIHPLSLQSLSYLIFDQFLLILKSLPLEPLGPRFSTVHRSSRSFLVTLVSNLGYGVFSGY